MNFYFKRSILLVSIIAAISVNGTEIREETENSESPQQETENSTISLDLINEENSENLADNNSSATPPQRLVQCLQVLDVDNLYPKVQLVNDTELIKLLTPNPNITRRDQAAQCVVVLFYSKFCPFSSMAAPHFNALPRSFHGIKFVAINAFTYRLFNTQNGIFGVPTIMLFHAGRPVAKFNDSEYNLALFSRFITKYTGIAEDESNAVTSEDFGGPVTSVPSKESDMFLIISWAFIIVCAAYYFTKSKFWKWIVEAIQSNWRESEAHAQHEHVD